MSYFTSSALVSGKEWFASISKILLTKTLELKVSKMGIVQHMFVRKAALMSSVHFVPCSRGPSLRIISRNAGMRFGLKHDFMSYKNSQTAARIVHNQHQLSFTSGRVQYQMGTQNVWKQSV